MTERILHGYATHHKTGTLWMAQVFSRIARALDVPYYRHNRENLREELEAAPRSVVFSWRSEFPDYVYDLGELRLLHIIRDPRDVLLSGAKYHRKATQEQEEWLHRPKQKWDGMTYQEKINSLENDFQRIKFEMNNKHLETLRQMTKWDYDHPSHVEVKFEDLMQDHDTELFHSCLLKLGFSEEEAEMGRKVFWERSVFGGLADPDKREGRLSQHIQSADKPKKGWEAKIPRRIAEIYCNKFGDDLIRLGYETDKSWVDRIETAEA